MKKDGFTLVELLAVIVIIGIIASIAIISVNSTLKNSKNSLSKVQQNNIVEASKAYYLKEGMNQGVTCVSVSDLISKGYIESNEVLDPKTGEPMGGSVKITNINNKHSYEYNESACLTGDTPVTPDGPAGSIFQAATAENKTLAGIVPTGNFNPGEEYIINVDGTHEYHFYVLSTEGDKVNLIMSRNICSDGTLATTTNICLVAWTSQEDYNDDTNWNYGNSNKGPITAMNYIYEATKNWSNIENINMNYTDEGNMYGGVTTSGNTTTITMTDGTVTATYNNLKARLPKYSEMTGAGCTGFEGSCPAWIVNGLNAYTDKYPTGTKEDISGIIGYWSLSSLSSYYSFAWDAGLSGNVNSSGVGYDGHAGVRPVITVSKSSLS